VAAVSELRQGAAAVLPLLPGVVPFALLFGALAAAKGLSPLEVLLMSALVFAGGSQFLALELWAEPLPVAALALSTFLINARHLLMGAALAEPLARFGRRRSWASLLLITDETFAIAMRRHRDARLTPAFWVGLGVVLWASWVALTTLGALLGAAVTDPARYGLDFVFVAVFMVLLRGFWAGAASLPPWLASAAAALGIHMVAPGAWPVLAGAMAGIAVAALRAGR
jgi:4-azaleucine resistance transporter AzlC